MKLHEIQHCHHCEKEVQKFEERFYTLQWWSKGQYIEPVSYIVFHEECLEEVAGPAYVQYLHKVETRCEVCKGPKDGDRPGAVMNGKVICGSCFMNGL